MEITDLIVNRIKELAVHKKRVLAGVCGRAGSGKTTLVNKISNELKHNKIENIIYSGDWRFNLDSAERKLWMQEKWRTGIDAYLYAINQFSWWNFELIFRDLRELIMGKDLYIKNAYNRLSGKKDLTIDVAGIEKGIILFENCILGGVEYLENLDIILLVNTPDILCHERILKKDTTRRSLPEIMIRNLITMYSENIFFKLLFKNFSDKTIACDSEGNMTPFPEIENVSHIPIPITEKTFRQNRKATIFCDLEGIIIKHSAVPLDEVEDIEFIGGSLEKLKELQDNGYSLILTTSRPSNKIFGIIEKIRSRGLEFDQIVCDLPVGPRIQISDSKNGEPRAKAYVVKKNAGIKKLQIP